MLALHKLKVGVLRALCDEREINYSDCNKKQIIAVSKQAEKKNDAQTVEEGDNECYEGNECQAEDENSASDRQIAKDCDCNSEVAVIMRKDESEAGGA